MPHTRSAKKNLRKTQKRRMRNRAGKRDIKLGIKQFEDTLAHGSLEQLQADFVSVVKQLDKAAVRRIIHPNMAARKKSQLAQMVNKKKAAPPPAAPAQS